MKSYFLLTALSVMFGDTRAPAQSTSANPAQPSLRCEPANTSLRQSYVEPPRQDLSPVGAAEKRLLASLISAARQQNMSSAQVLFSPQSNQVSQVAALNACLSAIGSLSARCSLDEPKSMYGFFIRAAWTCNKVPSYALWIDLDDNGKIMGLRGTVNPPRRPTTYSAPPAPQRNKP